MRHYGRAIRQYVETELKAARLAEKSGDAAAAFAYLERAHVLGQASTSHHLHVHWRMFRWGLRQGDARECFGQLFRIVGAATKTAMGLVPQGNTGGSDVSPFRRMPVPPELAVLIEAARKRAREPK